jgi:hypothetical protein
VQGQGGAGTAGSETTTVIEPAKEKPKVNNKGPEAFIGGGVEGFTGRLASVIDPGATYGATLAYKPLSWVGVEASYSGAVNNVSDTGNRQDLVKNGGQAMATVGVGSKVQPYVAGGVGFDDYHLRGTEVNPRISSDTVGYVPVGIGIRSYMGSFTADARVTGDGLFSQGVVSDVRGTRISDIDNRMPSARYTGVVRLGATF